MYFIYTILLYICIILRFSKHSPYSLQITVAIEVIGLEIARFGPFVPAVYGYKPRAGFVCLSLCHDECFFNFLRGVTGGDVIGVGAIAWSVVPPY